MNILRHSQIIGCLLLGLFLYAQDPIPFAKEVQGIVQRNDSLWDASRSTIVFTGSSSIRFWEDLQQRFPEYQVLNAGFGGSKASDLLLHLDQLVLRYTPTKVFVYEGDNDIFAKKRPGKILQTVLEIVDRLQASNAMMEVILISAKPSISRWKLRGKYKRLNKKFLKLAQQEPRVTFVDVWHPMLNGRKLRKDIFAEDGLHMNDRGYEIWYQAIKQYVENP